MTENTALTRSTNFERKGRQVQRGRDYTTKAAPRTRQTRRERRVQHELGHDKIASRIGLEMMEFFEHGFEFEMPFAFIVEMEESGVINSRVVHDQAVRLGTIGNTVSEMLEDGRLRFMSEYVDGELVEFYVVGAEFRNRLRRIKVAKERKREARRQERLEVREQARRSGMPVPMSRRDRRRQQARSSQQRAA